jgi:NAD(P)-dependent dehydrogenase (short-subunit alcohol dehydrogenase family)
VQTSR